MKIEILHSGFDKLEVAFNGALPGRLRAALEGAKQRAVSNVEAEQMNLGGFDVWVKETGAKGGYAYVFTTEESREMWAVKDNPDPGNWNLRCVVSSAALAVEGWDAVKGRLLDQLRAWSTKTTDISVSRIDYAVDFKAPGWSVDPRRVICHRHCDIGEYSDGEAVADDDGMKVHWANRQVASLTVGTMPGRQVIVYDKSREVRASGKGLWHEIWGCVPDKSERVWRVEVRAGKEHLTRAGIKNFDDIERAIGTVFAKAMHDIRLAVSPDFDNATRAAVDPVWMQVQGVVAEANEASAGAVTWGRFIEGRRDEIATVYRQQLVGCAMGYAVTLGKSAMDTAREIAAEIHEDILTLWNEDEGRFKDKHSRASRRLKFLEPASTGKGSDNERDIRGSAVLWVPNPARNPA